MADSPLTSPSPQRLILVVDDDAEMRRVMIRALRRDGHDVLDAASGPAVMAAFHHGRGQGREPDVLVSDVRMPGMSGLELVARLRAERFEAPTLLVSAFPDEETLRAARALGVRHVLSKPFDLDELRSAVRRLLA